MASLRTINILLVDDHEDGLDALEVVLRSPQFRFVRARSGVEALKCLLNYDFAVILMDVQMPEMDGFEAASLIKTRPKTKEIPIIFLSAISKDDHYVYRGYESGAVDYLVKPFDPQILKSKVAVFTDLYLKNEEIKHQSELLRLSERRNQEQALLQLELESLQRYRNLADAIPNIVWRAQADGTLDYFNQLWCDYTGLSSEQSNGTGWQSMIHNDDLPVLLAAWNEARQANKAFEAEARILRANDKTYRWHLIRILPERSKSNQLIAWLGTATDIDDQKRIEGDLQQAIHARDEFLSIASHELLTPITSLRLQLQLSHRPGTEVTTYAPKKVLNMMELMGRQVDRLTALIDSLLDVTRLRAGKMDFSFEEVDVGQIIREVVDRFESQIKASKSTLDIQIGEPVTAHCDRSRIDQLLANLIGNAIKYGEGKPIQICLNREGDWFKLTIHDHGMGISDEDQARIFQRFERAAVSRSINGLGLGLYIVKQVVDAHNGKISVESTRGTGSKFTVAMPLNPAAAQGAEVIRLPRAFQ